MNKFHANANMIKATGINRATRPVIMLMIVVSVMLEDKTMCYAVMCYVIHALCFMDEVFPSEDPPRSLESPWKALVRQGLSRPR